MRVCQTLGVCKPWREGRHARGLPVSYGFQLCLTCSLRVVPSFEQGQVVVVLAVNLRAPRARAIRVVCETGSVCLLWDCSIALWGESRYAVGRRWGAVTCVV